MRDDKRSFVERQSKLWLKWSNLEQIKDSIAFVLKDTNITAETIKLSDRFIEDLGIASLQAVEIIQKIEIDLDDGVKHNYPLFGKALKKVVGLS